ncbi:hypothetical protein [uncultured Croceitalea sp.]|uniref:hypothetical protein n=1 Tax=uncultured Croceitalea sp. TaxID=1798908 RepID=UPI00374F04FC
MRYKNIIVLVLAIVIVVGCEDILEEPDISNQTVTVFAPLEGTVINTNTVNFNWDTLEDVRSYRMQLAQPNFTNTIQLVIDSTFVLDSTGNVATRLQQSLLNGNYAWRVKAINGGFETPYTTNSFEVNGDENADITPPNTPMLVAPTNGTTQDNTTVDFSWTREDVPGSAELDSIFFFQEEALTTLISKDIGANKAYSATVTAGTYFWVVKAYDTAGNESANSEVFNFTIN